MILVQICFQDSCQEAIDFIKPLIHMLEGFPITNVIDQDNTILVQSTHQAISNGPAKHPDISMTHSVADSATVVP